MDSTLLEQAKLIFDEMILTNTKCPDETLTANTMETFAKSSDLLQYLPFRNVTVTYDEDSKKTFINGMENEVIVFSGGDIDMDAAFEKRFENEKDLQLFITTQNAMKIKSLAGWLSRVIVKGDTEKDSRVFNGLQIRCKDDQLIDAINFSYDSYGLDELIASVDKPTHLFMNKTMQQRLVQSQKRNPHDTYVVYRVDGLRRRVTLYKDIPILIAGQDVHYPFDEILPFTEPDPSGVPQCTSIYCLSLAKNGLVGLQNGPMIVTDFGKLDTKPIYRTRIEWYVTLATFRPRSIARLRHIKEGLVKG